VMGQASAQKKDSDDTPEKPFFLFFSTHLPFPSKTRSFKHDKQSGLWEELTGPEAAFRNTGRELWRFLPPNRQIMLGLDELRRSDLRKIGKSDFVR